MRMLVTTAMLAACTCYGAGWNDAAWSNEYPTRAVYQNIYSATVERAVAAGVLTVNTGFPMRAPTVVLHSLVPSNTVCVTNMIGTNEYVVCWTNWTMNLVPWTNTEWRTDFYKVIGGQGVGLLFTIDYPSRAYLKAMWNVLQSLSGKFIDTSTNDATDLDEWLRSGYTWQWGSNECTTCGSSDGWYQQPFQRDALDIVGATITGTLYRLGLGANLRRYTATTNQSTNVVAGYEIDQPCVYAVTNLYQGATNWTDNWQPTIMSTSSVSWWLGGQRCMLNRTFAQTNVVGTGSNAVTNVVQYQVCAWSNFYGSTVPHSQMQYADWPVVKALSVCRTNIEQESVSVNVVGLHSRRDGVLCGDGGVTSGVGSIVWNTTQTLSKLFYALSVVATQGVVGSPSYTNVLGSNSMLGASIDYYADSTNMALYGTPTNQNICKQTLVEMRALLNDMRYFNIYPFTYGNSTGFYGYSETVDTTTTNDLPDFYWGVYPCDPSGHSLVDENSCDQMGPAVQACAVSSMSNAYVTPYLRAQSSYRCGPPGEGLTTEAAAETLTTGKKYFNVPSRSGGSIDVYFSVEPTYFDGNDLIMDVFDTGFTPSEYITNCGAGFYAYRKQASAATTGTNTIFGIGSDTPITTFPDINETKGFITSFKPSVGSSKGVVIFAPTLIYTE